MIGLLRVVGVANAAVWFGTVTFYTLVAAPALASPEVRGLLGEKNFPYFGGAISQLLLTRYFQVNLACAVIALLHLLAERLYFGRSSQKIWIWVTLALFGLNLLGVLWLGPRLRESHRAQHLVNATAVQREAAARSFRIWRGMFHGLNVIILAGVAGCLWRATHPPDELRFVGSGKFRG